MKALLRLGTFKYARCMSEDKNMISDEAAEAAAEAIGAYNAKAIGGRHVPIKDLSGLDREHALGEARAALEAAAPHMLGSALEEAADEIIAPGPGRAAAATWLRERAAQIRATK